MFKQRIGNYGIYYGDTYDTSSYLSETNTLYRETNAKYIYKFFKAHGWTLNAIAAILGNMERESTLNPGCWQSNKVNVGPAYGLVQWDGIGGTEPLHFRKHTYWCDEMGYDDPSTIDASLDHIIFELNITLGKAPTLKYNYGQYYKTSAYPETFKQFTQSTKSVEYLTYAFVKNYERAGVEAMSDRIKYAEKWYNFFASQDSLQENNPEVPSILPQTFKPRIDRVGATNGADNAPGIRFKNEIANNERTRFFYQTNNQFYNMPANPPHDYGMPNCTCYAFGRFYEILASIRETEGVNYKKVAPPNLSRNSAHTFYTYNQTNAIYPYGDIPKLGAIICWRPAIEGDNVGHVGIVEDIIYDTNNNPIKIITSESGYGRSYFWRNLERSNSDGHWGGTNSTAAYDQRFQGFIYPPYTFDDVSVTVAKKSEVKSLSAIEVTDQTATLIGQIFVGDDSTLKCEVNGVVKESKTVDSSEYVFKLTGLVPCTKYTVKVYFGNNKSSYLTATFTTQQSYPQPATNVKLSTTDLKLPDSIFNLTFCLQSEDNWSYWKNNTCGYDLHFMLNGRTVATIPYIFKPAASSSNKTFKFIPEGFIVLEQDKQRRYSDKSAKTDDNLQIGIQTWTTSNKGEKLLSLDGVIGSNSICLKEYTHKIYLKNT